MLNKCLMWIRQTYSGIACLPVHTLLRKIRPPGHKTSKEGLTLFLRANVAGDFLAKALNGVSDRELQAT